MTNKQKFKIGEFSKLMQVTVKTLRHYEKKRLLMPDSVDEWTGYRYYTLCQMQRLNTIRDLQRLGFSLDEIKDLLEDDFHEPDSEKLNEKIVETNRQLQLLICRRDRLLNWQNSRKTLKTMDKFSIQSLPPIIVASHREVIPDYSAIGDMIINKIAPEMQRLGCKCTSPSYCFTVEHNGEYTPTDIDVEYCEQVDKASDIPSSVISFRTLPFVPTAVCMKHIGPYDRLYASYVELFKYIEHTGRYRVCGQPRCCYIDGVWNCKEPEKWLTLIQVPVVELE